MGGVKVANKRILTENSNKHFTKEEKQKREESENELKEIGLSFAKPPKIISGCKFGKELYDTVKDTLVEKGLLNDQTYNTFGILCYNYHMYITACEQTKNISKRLNVKKIGTMDEGTFKQLSALKKQSKSEEVMYFKHFRQLCNDFVFTPSSLLRLLDEAPSVKKNAESIGVMLFG